MAVSRGETCGVDHWSAKKLPSAAWRRFIVLKALPLRLHDVLWRLGGAATAPGPQVSHNRGLNMRLLNWTFALSLVAALAATPALADDRGTPEQAKILLEKAAAHFKDVGADKAMADFNDTKAGYQDRDLFVFVYAADGKLLCVPGIPALLGRDATLAKDVDGKEYGKAIIAAANAGGGWTEYRMTNPATKKVEPKKTYSVKVGDYTLGSGAYILAGNDK
jgi:cytochrome c